MDIGSIWNSLYMSQLTGAQMYGLQSGPFQTYGSYVDGWQAGPWQYGLQTGTLYGDMIQTWQNAGFMDTLHNALTKYMETASGKDMEKIEGAMEEAGKDMDVSAYEGSVVQLGYGRALVYLPKEQKLMIVRAPEDSQNTGTKDTEALHDTKAKSADERGILVDQRKARASAAYRRTQKAGQQESQYPLFFKSLTRFT